MRALLPDAAGLAYVGEVPAAVRIGIFDGSGPLPDDADQVEFLVPPFLDASTAGAVMARLPRLEVVQALSAGVDALLGQVPPGVLLADARGVHDASTAEWIVAATLASVRELPRFALAQSERRWDHGGTDALVDKTVLIVGYGSIGAAVERRLAGFEVEVLRVARRARAGVTAISEVADLLPAADVVILIVPMTEDTRGLADATFLARMRDGALLVNAARGPVVDTGALLAELRSGRLRAALDVTDPEPLPAYHPLWTVPGLLLTPHVAGSTSAFLPRAYRLVGDQLRRYVAGEPLENLVDDAGY